MPAELRSPLPDHFSAYKERHANSAPKIRLATMASHKARDGPLVASRYADLVGDHDAAGQHHPEPEPEHPYSLLRAKQPQRAASI